MTYIINNRNLLAFIRTAVCLVGTSLAAQATLSITETGNEAYASVTLSAPDALYLPSSGQQYHGDQPLPAGVDTLSATQSGTSASTSDTASATASSTADYGLGSESISLTGIVSSSYSANSIENSVAAAAFTETYVYFKPDQNMTIDATLSGTPGSTGFLELWDTTTDGFPIYLYHTSSETATLTAGDSYELLAFTGDGADIPVTQASTSLAESFSYTADLTDAPEPAPVAFVLLTGSMVGLASAVFRLNLKQ